MISLMDLIDRLITLQLFLDHFCFRKSQEGLELANPVKRGLVTWQLERLHTHMISHSTKTHVTRVVTISAEELHR